MLKIGHRGAKGYFPENTLASFEHALKLGCAAVELDVQLSKDAIPVVIHDETVNRTTVATGSVCNINFKDLSLLGISSLEEILTFVDKKCAVFIEIKNPKATETVVQIISTFVKNKNWEYRLLQVSSFDFDVLQKVKQLNPGIWIGVLTEDSILDALQFAIKIKAHSIHPDFKLLNTTNVSKIKKYNFKIFPFTVNLSEDITFVKTFLVDGIISDFPDKI